MKSISGRLAALEAAALAAAPRLLSRRGLWLRAALYVVLAMLPVLIDGTERGTVAVLIVYQAMYQGGLALRAFIDTSPADVVDDADAAAAAAAAAPIHKDNGSAN